MTLPTSNPPIAVPPRTTTVTAVTDGVLASLEASDFLELATSGPGLRSRFLNLYGGGGIIAS